MHPQHPSALPPEIRHNSTKIRRCPHKLHEHCKTLASNVSVTFRCRQVGLWARLQREVGRWLISLDAANAFNSVSRAAIFAGLADVLPPLLQFVRKLYGADPSSLFFRMDDGQMRMIPSRTRVTLWRLSCFVLVSSP